MKEFIFFVVFAWVVLTVVGYTERLVQNRESIESCETKEILIIQDRIFKCTEIELQEKQPKENT